METTDADATVQIEGGGQEAITVGPRVSSPNRELRRGDPVGRYIVLEQIGKGGMGIVYRAYDPELDRRVALKVLKGGGPYEASADDRAQLLREAQSLAKLSHPNVVSIYDVGTHDGQVFMAIELVKGVALDEWLAEGERPWREVTAVFVAAGRGLAAAHDAGLVHRDFKPANVLLGDDGRVRVLDFGLARSEPELAEPSEPGPTAAYKALPVNTPETQDGIVVGTPTYMALEQHHGKAADAKSDQYSFCVALYEALYGVRPFKGKDVRALVKAKMERVPNPPARTLVPGWVFRIVARGLSRRPEKRFESMAALLEQLEDDPWPVWRRRGGVALVAAGVSLAALGVSRGVDPGGALCEGAAEAIEPTWGDDRRDAVEQAFEGSGVPYHASAFEAVSRVLDGYAEQWKTSHQAACEATHVNGVQSGELLDLRMSCLEQRRGELGALVDVLEQAQPQTIERAVGAAHSLSPLDMCDDAERLSSTVQAPRDDLEASAVEGVRSEIGRARVLGEVGRNAEGLEIARAAVERSRELSHRPVQAEALLLVGQLQEQAGDVAAAREALLEAAVAAKAGHHDEYEARAWIALVGTVGHKHAEFDRAREWGRVAQAVLEGMGGDDALQADLLQNIATVEFADSAGDKAMGRLDEALELRRATVGPDHPLVADTLDKMAFASLMMRDYEEAHRQHLRALEIREKALGPDHPAVATSHRSVGFALTRLGRDEDAREHYERTLGIRKAALGPDNPEVAKILGDLGSLHSRLGDAEKGERFHRQAVDILSVDGAPTPALGAAHYALGATLEAADKLAEARTEFQTALEIRREIFGPAHPFVVGVESSLAELAEREGDWARAAGHYQNIVDATDASGGKHDASYGSALGLLGRARFEAGEVGPAVHALEGAAELVDEDAQLEFWLARALWREGKARGRALELAQSAAASTEGELRAEIEAWLKERS